MAWGLAEHYGFSLETPFCDLPEKIRDILFWGTHGEEIALVLPPGGRPDRSVGKRVKFDGIAHQIDTPARGEKRSQTIAGYAVDFDVEVLGPQSQQRIAHRSSHHDGLEASCGQFAHDLPQRGW